MKKHISIWLLMMRASLYKILLIILIAGASQVFLFYMTAQRMLASNSVTGLEVLAEKSGLVWIFAAACLAALLCLCRMGCAYGAKTGYTLARLSVSEKTVFFWQCVCNCLCLLILWFAQICTLFCLLRIYITGTSAQAATGQSVFLAFYRNKFLHGLFPLAETSLWVRNIMLVLALGVSAAAFPWHQRHGKPAVSIGVEYILAAIFFRQKTGSFYQDVPVILLLIVCIAVVLMNVLGKESVDADI